MQIMTLDARHLRERLPAGAAAPGLAVTIGNFDGVHRGHRMLLDQVCATARERGLGSALLTFEPHPREFFSPADAPLRLTSLEEKAALLAQTGLDLLVVGRFDRHMAGLSPQRFVRDLLVGVLGARHLVVGDDFCFGRARGGDLQTLRQAGGELGFSVEALDSLRSAGGRVSSSLIRQCIDAGEFAAAGELLGRWHSVAGRVVRVQGTRLLVELARGEAPRWGRHTVLLHPAGVDAAVPGLAWRGGNPATLVIACEGGRAVAEGLEVRLSFVGEAQAFASRLHARPWSSGMEQA